MIEIMASGQRSIATVLGQQSLRCCSKRRRIRKREGNVLRGGGHADESPKENYRHTEEQKTQDGHWGGRDPN